MDAITDTTTWYYYDGRRVLLRTTVSGGGTESDGRMFVFGNYLDEVLVMHDGAGDLYYAHDHLSSPVALLDDAGAVLERYERACPEHSRGNAYGSVQILTSAFYSLASSQYGNPYTFTGRELDTMDNNTLHLMYYRARTTDPETGRFMQRDPLGIDPSGSKENRFFPLRQYENVLNIYEYVKSNPLIHNDSMGLDTRAFSLDWNLGSHHWGSLKGYFKWDCENKTVGVTGVYWEGLGDIGIKLPGGVGAGIYFTYYTTDLSSYVDCINDRCKRSYWIIYTITVQKHIGIIINHHTDLVSKTISIMCPCEPR